MYVDTLRFRGMYHFTTDPEDKPLLERAVDFSQPAKDQLSFMMYRHDAQKGELKPGSPLNSAIFRARNLVVGFSGENAIAFMRRVFDKANHSGMGAALEDISRKAVPHATAALVTREHMLQALDEYLQSLGKTEADLEEINVPIQKN